MKTTALILITLSFMHCKSVQFDTTPPFKITQASYKNWFGGQPGVGGVHVFIDYTSKSAVTFDSIYFMNTVVKLEMNERKGVKYLAGRFNTTTVNSREDLILHREGTKELGNKIPALKIPFVLKENETVISYKEGGKIKYFKIAGLKKNDTDFYP